MCAKECFSNFSPKNGPFTLHCQKVIANRYAAEYHVKKNQYERKFLQVSKILEFAVLEIRSFSVNGVGKNLENIRCLSYMHNNNIAKSSKMDCSELCQTEDILYFSEAGNLFLKFDNSHYN